MQTTHTADAAYRANMRGAAIMVVSMAGFTINDAAIKLVMRDLPFGQSIFLRGAIISAVLLLVALRDGGLAQRPAPRDRLMIALRVLGEVGSTLLYLQALRHMAIADLAAIIQVLPLLVMVAASLLYGEPIGWRRMIATGVGMAGVLLILRPGTPTFDLWSWIALASVGMLILRELATRAVGASVRSSTIALSAAVAVALTGFVIPSADPWRMPTATESFQLLFSASFLSVGYMTAVAAMRTGDISFVAPFRYASLLIAILVGLVVFGEWPDLWTWAGSALIVGAGAYVILNEARIWGRRR